MTNVTARTWLQSPDSGTALSFMVIHYEILLFFSHIDGIFFVVLGSLIAHIALALRAYTVQRRNDRSMEKSGIGSD